MINRRYRVLLDGGQEMTKLFVAGHVVRINDNANAPFSFNLAVDRGSLQPLYVNRIAVRDDAPYLAAMKRMPLGQQLFCEVNARSSSRTAADGTPYEDLWLNAFEWGRRPKRPGDADGYADGYL